MSKKPQILVLTVAALAIFRADAATTDTKVMRALINANLVKPEEVIANSKAFEQKFDDVTAALRIGKTEIDRSTNALVMLKKMKEQIENEANEQNSGLFGEVNSLTGGDVLIKSYVADMKRLYNTVKWTLNDDGSIKKFGAERFTIANSEIIRVKRRFENVRVGIQADLKKKN